MKKLPVMLLWCVCEAALVGALYFGHPVRADGWHEPPFVSSPLDFWRRNRERLGFSPGANVPDPKAPPPAKPVPAGKPAKPMEIDDAEAAQKKYQELLKQVSAEKDPQKRQALQDEVNALGEALTAYKLLAPGKKPGEAVRRAYTNHLIATMAYANSYNLNPAEFPEIMGNREKYMNEVIQVLREMGPEVAPQLWEHLRWEIVLYGTGKRDKSQAAQEVKRLQQLIQELRDKQKSVADKASWNSIEEYIQRLEKELASVRGLGEGPAPNSPGTDAGGRAPLAGNRSGNSFLDKKNSGEMVTGALRYDRMGLCISDDYIELLSRALVAIGVPGLDHWVQGLWDSNAAVRKQALKLVQELGLGAVPSLLQAGKDQPAPSKRNEILRALAAVTAQDFGDSLEKYEAWWLAHPPALPPTPPQPPEVKGPSVQPPEKAPKKDNDPDDMLIGPKK